MASTLGYIRQLLCSGQALKFEQTTIKSRKSTHTTLKAVTPNGRGRYTSVSIGIDSNIDIARYNTLLFLVQHIDYDRLNKLKELVPSIVNVLKEATTVEQANIECLIDILSKMGYLYASYDIDSLHRIFTLTKVQYWSF